MNIETIRLLYDYTYWAHQKVWNCVLQLDEEQFNRQLNYSWGTIQAQLVHTMSAEWIWFNRMKSVSPSSMIAFEDYPTRETIRTRWDEVEREVRAYVDSLTPDDLMSDFDYQTTGGKSYTNKRLHILLHVVNHGTDHRGQILAMIHAMGGETVEQDLIYYLRSQ